MEDTEVDEGSVDAALSMSKALNVDSKELKVDAGKLKVDVRWSEKEDEEWKEWHGLGVDELDVDKNWNVDERWSVGVDDEWYVVEGWTVEEE